MKRTACRAILGSVLLAACGGGDEPARTTAAVDTVSGVERWSYGAEPAAELGWTVDTVAVVGDALAEDAYQFAEVSAEGLASDDAGNLYVLDRQGSRVLKYGPDGRHLATFGRKGEGPGELSQPLGLEVGPGDTVWVSDFSTRRLTGFPQDGGEPRMISYAEDVGMPSPDFAVLDGGFLQTFRPMFAFGGRGGPRRVGGGAGAEGEEEEDGPRRLPLVRLGAGLEPGDTLWRMPEPPLDMVQLDLGERRMVMMMAREFAPALQWSAFADGSAVVSDTSAYVLRLIAAEGGVRRLIERGPAPVAVTEAHREAARERLRAAEGVGGTSVRIGGAAPDEATRLRMLEERLEKMTFASELPRVLDLRVDPRDRIWVGVAGEVPDSIARIDVYDRDGALLGELRGVPMPDVFLGRDRLGVLRRDEMDVEQVVVLRLDEGRVAGE